MSLVLSPGTHRFSALLGLANFPAELLNTSMCQHYSTDFSKSVTKQ